MKNRELSVGIKRIHPYIQGPVKNRGRVGRHWERIGEALDMSAVRHLFCVEKR